MLDLDVIWFEGKTTESVARRLNIPRLTIKYILRIILPVNHNGKAISYYPYLLLSTIESLAEVAVISAS